MDVTLDEKLKDILSSYHQTFEQKSYTEGNNETDLLMDVFGITSAIKQENRQYWGRELGMCWQRVVIEVFRATHLEFGTAVRVEQDEPCDFTLGKLALDTKYRIGSGDSGTLKKFRAYGQLLREQGYTPILLILRTDNLPSAIHACLTGGWEVYTGNATFEFIYHHSQVNLKDYLVEKAANYIVNRQL